MKKNLLLTFMFAFIPGAGQMYLKMMKRGLSIMILAGTIIVLMVLLSLPILLIPFFILMAYSYFDTFNIRNLEKEELENYKDQYIWENEEVSKIFGKNEKLKGNRTIGTILIILGVYCLINNIVIETLYMLEQYDLASILSRYIPVIFTSVASIYIGIKMKRR